MSQRFWELNMMRLHLGMDQVLSHVLLYIKDGITPRSHKSLCLVETQK